MTDEEEKGSDQTVRPDDVASQSEEKPTGNSLEDASDEMVGFMEESEEPGHAGRGDGG